MTIGCPDCGALVQVQPLPRRSVAVCYLCGASLERTAGRSIGAALACSIATFLLLIPANMLPLLKVDIFNMQSANIIGLGIATLWTQHWFLISGCTALFVLLFPFLFFGLLTAVLGSVAIGYRAPWVAHAFRWAVWLEFWAMTDVFLLASFIGFYRMVNLQQAVVDVGAGGWCFAGAGLLTIISRAALDRRTVWRALAPEAEVPPDQETLSCVTCDLIQPVSQSGRPCPRCGAKLRIRKFGALPRTAALVATGLILFVPANILPMNVSMQLGTMKSYTIYTGIRELFVSGLWPLALIIFCTSILFPFGKLVAVAWCIVSVRRRSPSHLLFKTKLFRIVAEVGRWSKTDPFTIVFFVPLVNFGGLASASAGWGATAFMAMSVATMLASVTFDPRLMWDAGLSGGTD